ncbi:Fe(3+) ABC transporter substrate-binding protein [Marinicella sediminis]|uniref:Fe(3+) ABC transporter substrate-binding protein n=1 Tax=Marinicella sediminis TaxID=1792834 RepID=A0ABV7JD61_9GAMM|nr:Fe(3+) ABC transporter substrate-binding protein [Marinicella sediminis]
MQKHHTTRCTLMVLIVMMIIQGCAVQSQPEVNVYSSRKEALIKPMLDRFTEVTGIRVNLVTGKDDALIERLKAEGAASPADVLMTVDAGRLYRAKSQGLTQAIDSPLLQQSIPPNYRDPDNHWFGLSLRARPIMYAKDRVNPASLTNYASLTTEQWRKKVCIRSSGNIYNQSLVASMLASESTAAVEQWAAALVKNFARQPVGGDRDQIKAVAAGLCDVAVANTYYLFGMLQSEDPTEAAVAQKVGVFWPNQQDRGTHVNVSGIAVTKAADHVGHAQRLIEFMIQAESQNWFASANGEYPVVPGTAVHPTLAEWGEFRKDAINLSRLGELNNEAVKIMDRVGWP